MTQKWIISNKQLENVGRFNCFKILNYLESYFKVETKILSKFYFSGVFSRLLVRILFRQ